MARTDETRPVLDRSIQRRARASHPARMDHQTKTMLTLQAAQMENVATSLLEQARALREAIAHDIHPGTEHTGTTRAYNTSEVAAMLGLGESTVKAAIASGAIPSVMIGGARRVLREDLDAYLSSLRPTA